MIPFIYCCTCNRGFVTFLSLQTGLVCLWCFRDPRPTKKNEKTLEKTTPEYILLQQYNYSCIL